MTVRAHEKIRVAYLVSRFPAASETFVVREMQAVEATGLVDISPMSLFPSRDDFLHPAARPWLSRLYRPRPGEASRALASWLGRRPLRSLSAIAGVVSSMARSPRLLPRALVATLLGFALATRMRERGIDRVHAHFASYPALAAWVCARLLDIPYSFTAHAYDIFVDQAMLDRKVSDADFVATISRFNRDFLSEYDGAGTPIEVVHCGVDPDAYEYRPRNPPLDGPASALCVASLQEKKGHAVLLEALAGAPELARLRVELIGGGELGDSLRTLAERLGVADRVSFEGPRDEQAVRERLASADLFVLPSVVARDGQMEGLPVALIEALACGLTAVSTRLSGIPELIDDGRTGFLAEPGDAGSLEATLIRALAGATVDHAAARKLVEDEFDVRRSGERMAALFRERSGPS